MFANKQVNLYRGLIMVLLSVFVIASGAAQLAAVERTSKPSKRKGSAAQSLDLFHAMSSGELDVQLIPKDSTQATVIIENKSKKPLKIQLPAAFAGVPVLAQDNFGGVDDGGGGGAAQGFGGGMGMGMGGMGMGMGGMGGMFNVAPESTKKMKVRTVCLEHGKRDPNPRIPYKMVPIESFVKDKAVIEICKMLGNRKVSQHVAQAAVWHLTDKMDWPTLAKKIKVRHLNGTTELYFSLYDLRRAFVMVQRATQLAKQYEAPRYQSPGELEAIKTNATKLGAVQ